MHRKTKIIATLGPAVAEYDSISRMVEAGMNVARLNFSHGDHGSHRQFIEWVRHASVEHNQAVGILQDIQGPRIRVGTFHGGAVELEPESVVELVPGEAKGNAGQIHIENLDAANLEPGSKVLLADGLITLEVEDVGEFRLKARVVDGGVLGDHKGAAFPGARIDLPPITEKDVEDLEFGMQAGIDMVAASFVSSAADLRSIRHRIGDAPLIAKVESGAAYENLQDILVEADGVMVARGDLGVDISLERLPRVQKEILAATNAAGVISITATEMLESMTASPRPTRAEVTDVANAVLDGTDAVMLSAETAVGKYPIRAIKQMDAICQQAEASPGYGAGISGFLADESRFASAVASAAVDAADYLGIETVVAFTESGSTARLLSKYRPQARIVAFTAVERTYHHMALLAAVLPLMFERMDSTDEMIASASAQLVERGVAERGEAVIMVAGVPPNQRASTNIMKVHVVGSGTHGMGAHD